MKFRLIIDIPEETIINYQKWSKSFVDLLDEPLLEEFIRDSVQDQTKWDVEKCTLIDKKDFNKLKEFLKSNS